MSIKRLIKGFAKGLRYILAGFILLLLAVFAVVQLPAIKTKLAIELVGYIAEKTDHRITLEDVEVAWLDRVILNKLAIYDDHDSLMTAGNEVHVDFDLFRLIKDKELLLDGIWLKKGTLNLVRYPGERSLNLKNFLLALSGEKKQTRSKKSLRIHVGNIEIEDFTLRHINLEKEKKDSVLDPNHLELQISYSIFSDFEINKDSVESSILTLRGQEVGSGLTIRDLQAEALIAPTNIVLGHLNFETENSVIKDSLAMSFESFASLGAFTDAVNLELHLKESVLSLLDLKYFARGISIDSTLLLSGKVSGPVSSLILDDLSVATRDGTSITTSGTLLGLPDLSTTFLDLDVSRGNIKASVLKRVIGKYSFGDDIRFTGNFSGFISDFVAYGDFRTDHGKVISDINFKIQNELKAAQYRGNLRLIDFDLGRMLQDTLFGRGNIAASILGKGITKDLADFRLKSVGNDVEFNNYSFQDLKVEGRFKSNFYDGIVEVSDPHCVMKGITKIDLTGSREILLVDVDIDTLNLEPLGWYPEPLKVEANITSQIQNLSLDSVQGWIKVKDLAIENDRAKLDFDELVVGSNIENDNRVYQVSSPLFSADLRGNFLPSTLLLDLPGIVKTYEVLLTSERNKALQKLEALPALSSSEYYWDMDLQLSQVNPIFELLGYPLEIAQNAEVSTSFRKAKNVRITGNLSADSLNIEGRRFYQNQLDLDATKDLKSLEVLALIQLYTQGEFFDNQTDMFMESVWFNNEINSHLKLKGTGSNSITLNSETRYQEDSIVINIKPSDIVLVENHWSINPSNFLVWSNEVMSIRDFEFYSKGQTIAIEGIASPGKATRLEFEANSLELSNLSQFIDQDVFGSLDMAGFIIMDSGTVVTSLLDMEIDTLSVEGSNLGSFVGSMTWDDERQAMVFNCDVQRVQKNRLSVSGLYKPYEVYDQLEADLNIINVDLGVLQPFVRNSFADIKGDVSGDFRLGGPLLAPTFIGKGKVMAGRFSIPYLGTTYNINGEFSMDPFEISLLGMPFSDQSNGSGRLYGSIYHENFRNIKTNFFMEFKRLQLLNTTLVDNEIYFGRAYGTGNIRLNGPTSDLNLSAEITSDPGTRIFFPLSSGNNVAQEDFISFKSFQKTDTVQFVGSKNFSNNGMSVDLDLDVTPDAYAELIFDAQSGDIIRGRAKGNLQVKMDQSGEFSLLGGLTIDKGEYNFTVPGISKEFELQRGGTISWSGDPYDGTVDLTASYRQLGDLSDWDNSLTNTNKIPFLVVLDLEGAMLKPNISFQIATAQDFTVLPGSDNQSLRRFLITTNDREDELNRQVFSLLMLRKLSPQSSFAINEVGRGISGSVSEILSNQLSYWLSQSNENLEVDIDLVGLDQDAFNTFQYRLAYSFLDGRLRVSGGNSLNSSTAGNTDLGRFSDNNNLIGNWSVEYLLSSDGRLRLKFFSRSNQALSTNSENNQQTGVSLQVIRSFDQFREIMSRARKESNSKASPNLPPSASPISTSRAN